MPAHYQLRIITLEKVAFDGEVESVIAPGTEGSLGIWAHHAPLITALASGKLMYRRTDGQEVHGSVQRGFLEVHRNVVTILADGFEVTT